MKKFIVTYTEDLGATLKTILVNALDYTKAYLSASFALPFAAIITTVCEI